THNGARAHGARRRHFPAFILDKPGGRATRMVDLDDLILAWFGVIDEGLQPVLAGKRLRERGPEPRLADSEVLTMEVVGAYLGLEQDAALVAYFRRHYGHFFPMLVHLHRTTFTRRAANLQVMKDRLWQWLRERIPHD